MSGYAALLEGAKVSPFLTTNELLAPQVLNLQRETEQRNALLSQQELGLRQQEFGLRQSEFGLKQQDAAAAREAARRAIAGLGADGTGSTGSTGGTPLAPVDTGTIEPEAQTRAFAVRDGLIKRGLDPETATAFAANALHESSAKPDTGAGDAGASHGLFQWRDDRYQGYIKKYGRAPETAPLDEQLDYVMHELNGPESTARGRILGAQGVADKAGQVSEAYLRPKDTVGEMNRRAGTALKLAGLNVPPGSDAQAGMTDQAWLDQQAKTYPSLAGPNVNQQAGTQPSEAPGGPLTPAPYQVASLTPTPPPSPTAPAAGTTGTPTGNLGLETKQDGSVGTPNAGGLAAPSPQPTPLAPSPAAPPAAPPAALPSPGPQAPAPVAPPVLGPHNLTHDDVRRFTDQLVTARTPEQVHAVMNDIEATKQRNIANQHQYQQDMFQRQQAAAAQQHQTWEDQRQVAADARLAGQQALDAKKVELEAAANEGKAVQRTFEQENTLRDEFQKLTGDFRIVQTSYENIRSAAKANDGAGDMSMLYNYVRLLDPTSVVRESEFAAAASSGSFGQRVQGAVERVLSGARMPETLRQSFIREGRNLYDNQLRSHNTVADQYEKLAKDNNLNPGRVVTRFARPQDDEGGPRQIKTDADFEALPSGAVFIDPQGKQRKKP